MNARRAGAERGRAPAGRAHGTRPGAAAKAGFSLIELTAVVAIVALLVGFVAPNLGIGGRRTLDGEAEGLRAELELARQQAIATGTPHRLALDLDADRFGIERFETPPPPAPEPREPGGAVDLSPPRPAAGSFEPLPTRLGRGRALPDGIRFAGVETPEGPVERGAVAIAFWPDGSATPARIRLANEAGDAVELEVLPLADAVRVHAVR